jgi:hypothetical protein
MFYDFYFADRTNSSRIQHDVYIDLKEDIRVQKLSNLKLVVRTGGFYTVQYIK